MPGEDGLVKPAGDKIGRTDEIVQDAAVTPHELGLAVGIELTEQYPAISG